VGEAVKRVLLVDDEPLVLRTTAELLTEGGYDVLEASAYDDALALIEASPDTSVMVTDINLSGRPDGIALARSVAERWPHIRILIVSGAVRPAGGDYPESAIFFTKPYAPGALLTLVKDCADW
jgi:two-component system, response regulator PdtaR